MPDQLHRPSAGWCPPGTGGRPSSVILGEDARLAGVLADGALLPEPRLDNVLR
jgi:hypothetical protein